MSKKVIPIKSLLENLPALQLNVINSYKTTVLKVLNAFNLTTTVIKIKSNTKPPLKYKSDNTPSKLFIIHF